MISAPASKSYLQRAIAIAALCKGGSEIPNYYPSKDAEAALNIIQKLGAKAEFKNESLFIIGISDISQTEVVIDAGEAGLSARMFAPIAAMLYEKCTVTGEGSIAGRPMNMVIEALEQLGCKVESKNGCLPLTINGKIKPGTINIDGSESSQLLTGLLISLPFLKDDSVINVSNLKSIPYIKMTIDILKEFGIVVSHQDFKTFHIKGNQTAQARKYRVEGDWSGAAFHLVGGAIAGEVLIKDLNPNSLQADIAILEALKICGAFIRIDHEGVFIKKEKLNPFTFDATHCPDLFPPLAVLAACCKGETTIIGTDRLKHKESNRALTIQQEFQKLGVEIILENNKMIIKGGNPIKGGTVHSHNDHRIAMALATLAYIADSEVIIEGAEAVSKSYPTFFETKILPFPKVIDCE